MIGPKHTGFLALHFPDAPAPAGYLPPVAASALLDAGLIGESAGQLLLNAQDNLSDRLEDIRNLLARSGLIGPFRGEAMPVRSSFDGTRLGTIDRSALRILGLWATKVHVNGVVREAGGLSVWLSRRAATSAAEPGAFDTLVAGGQSAGETELETAFKEGHEEAGLTATQMAGLEFVRRIPVQYASDLGFHQELLAIYDLEVDPKFEPRCGDGEIDQHIRVPLYVLRGNGATLPLKHSSHIVCEDLLDRYGVRYSA